MASGAAQRVQEALATRGAACRVVELQASTRTAQEAATAIGCHVEVWAAAGTPHTVFVITPAELVAVTGGQVAPVGRSPT